MTCYIERLPPSDFPYAYAVRWDYNEPMVDAIKQYVPSRLRRWQPAHKRWVVTAAALDTVCALADAYCGGWVEVVRADGPPAATAAADAYAVLHLLPTAPPAVVKAVYKALSKLEHPDRGGDTAQMQRINAAYHRLTGGS